MKLKFENNACYLISIIPSNVGLYGYGMDLNVNLSSVGG